MAATRSTPTSCTATPGTATSAASWSSRLYDIPLVVTVHSLEPLRPWKREQLGGGYDLSQLGGADRARDGRRGDRRVSQGPATTCCATSRSPPERVHVIHNGIDTELYRPGPRDRCARPLRHRSAPSVRALRGAHHAPEGHHPPGATRSGTSTPAIAGRALRRRAGHARDRGRDARPASPRCSADAARRHLDPRRCCREEIRSSTATRRSSAARRSTSRSGSSTSRRWPARTAGGGHRRRRHPRGGGRRRDRRARARRAAGPISP